MAHQIQEAFAITVSWSPEGRSPQVVVATNGRDNAGDRRRAAVKKVEGAVRYSEQDLRKWLDTCTRSSTSDHGQPDNGGKQ